jgi:hypothetical protein
MTPILSAIGSPVAAMSGARAFVFLRRCYALSFALSVSPAARFGFSVGRKPPDWRLHRSA